MLELLEPIWRFMLGVTVLYLLFVASWLWLHIEAFTYGLLAKDGKWKSKKITADEAASDDWDQTIELIFIRHGESTWNDTFNRTKFPPLFAKRLLYSALMEISLIISGNQDSWFYDSPLSELGLEQVASRPTLPLRPAPRRVSCWAVYHVQRLVLSVQCPTMTPAPPHWLKRAIARSRPPTHPPSCHPTL